VALAGSFATGWFTGGRLRWTGGANAGLDADIRSQTRTDATVALDLWQPPARNVAPGDAFILTAGCDKRFSTCRGKFANSLNFQGFPHMPGNDFVVRPAPGSSTALDGGSLFR
ncbi:phage BR0599 family protein, partial [Methylobacterium haplocladii]